MRNFLSGLLSKLWTTRRATPTLENRLNALLAELGVLIQPDDMPRRIEVCEEGLRLVERGTPAWAFFSFQLATSLTRNPYGSPVDSIENAIRLFNQALEVYHREAYPEDWADTQNSLANAYMDRTQGVRADNIEHAVQLYEQALEVRTREASPFKWAMTHNNLGTAYQGRTHGVRADNIERAIHHFEQTLEVCTREAYPDHWGDTHNNLGAAYRVRIEGERTDNIERAIHHYEQALEVRTREASPSQWATTLNNLANAYVDRIKGKKVENIERAIQLYEQALEVRTREASPDDWAMTLNNLANAYMDRVKGEKAENIERAIQLYEQALEVRTREAYPYDWAETQNNLGTACMERLKGERGDNIERAIRHFQQAIEVYTREAYPDDWAMTQKNLGAASHNRIRGVRGDNIKRAIHHYEQALEVWTLQSSPHDCRETRCNLGNLFFHEGRWKDALSSYQVAIEAGNETYSEAYTDTGRRTEISEISPFYSAAAYCALRLERFDRALVTFEQGKARLLAEVLRMADLALANLSDTERNQIMKTRERIRSLDLAMSPPAQGGQRDLETSRSLQEAHAELRHIIEQIRAKHPEFMPSSLELSHILGLIPPGGALIAPLFTPKGCAVFVIPHGAHQVSGDHIIWLDSLTEMAIFELVMGPAEKPESGWLGAYFAFLRQRTGESFERWQSMIEKVTADLWDLFMGTVFTKLYALGIADRAPVILIPTGGLGLLPLHAAWRDEQGKKRYFADDYTVTYGPSLYALSMSNQRVRESARQGRSLLGVINPTLDLRFAAMEGQEVASHFEPPFLRSFHGNEAIKDTVMKNMGAYAYLHFSCHGFHDWQNIMNSGLRLAHGEPLNLSDIMNEAAPASARLVTLSACETGITDIREVPQEFIGLPTGFLQAGVPGVVSTLWAVDEVSTAIFFKQFYHYHLKVGLRPAMALTEAQRWLCDASVADMGLAEYYENVYRESGKEDSEALTRARYYSANPDIKPFEHPYYWAGFIFSGV